jgi:hypothetical protein
MYKCECGAEFLKSRSYNSHKSHCGKPPRKIPDYNTPTKCKHCGEMVHRSHITWCLKNPNLERNRGIVRKGFASMLSKRRISLEHEVSKEMESEGYEVFIPNTVCDRIAIKDGKVYFVEFKPANDPTLRVGQQKVSDVAGDQYIIRFYKQ